MELQTVQSVLQNAGIEVDLRVLQNPTEEFMISLIMEYLNKFDIDGNEIAKPTPDQLDCVSDEDSALSAIQAINLHAVLAKICEGIYLKDLALTDITSPGCKKTCKRIKVLFNFFSYVSNKRMEKECLFSELEERRREFEEMIERKTEYTVKIGAVINERENKLECIQKLKEQIENLTMQMEKGEQIREKLQKSIEEATVKQQEHLQKFNALKAKAHELHQETKDLQSKVVRSPEKFMGRIEKLKKILDSKLEERQNVNNARSLKKTQIEKNELAEAEVKMCYNKMINIGTIMQKLKETDLQINSTKRQLRELEEEIVSLERKSSNVRNDSSNSDSEELQESQRVLSELHNSFAEKQREHLALRNKLEKLQTEYKKAEAMLEKEKQTILALGKNYANILQDFKRHFENEVTEEMDMRQTLRQLWKSK